MIATTNDKLKALGNLYITESVLLPLFPIEPMAKIYTAQKMISQRITAPNNQG